MFVKDMVKEAKNGSNEALKELEVYYLDIFKNNVKRFCGEEYIEEALYDYSSLIREYINASYVEEIDCFLRRKSKLYPKEKYLKKQLGNQINFDDEDNMNFVVDHYTNAFFEKMKSFNNVLNEDDLFVYSLNLMKYLVFNLYLGKDFRININARIYREIENYKNNEEHLIRKFILFVGYNERIIKYFMNKYSYLRDEYVNTFIHSIVTKKFDVIIEESLKDLTEVNESVEGLIKRILVKLYKEEKLKEKDYINKAKNGSNVALGVLYNNYSYVINVMFDKYKDAIDLKECDLKKIIKEKYNEFINAYVNGNSNTDINKYLSTRLNDYMRNKLKKHIYSGTVVDESNLYLKLIENEIDNVLDFIPKEKAQKELETACIKYLKKRTYSKRVNSNLKASLTTCIKNKINYINNKYKDDSLLDKNVKVKYPNKK